MWRMEGMLYSQVETFGLDMPCSFRNKSRFLSLLLAIHPMHEIASDSSYQWEFGTEGQSLLRLYRKTEVIWEIVRGWTRQGHAWNDLQFQPFLTVIQGNPDGASHPYCAIQTVEILAVKHLGSGCAQNSFSLIRISSSWRLVQNKRATLKRSQFWVIGKQRLVFD